jgi:hypothetical protein
VNVSKEYAASIFRVESTLVLKIEAACPSEMLLLTGKTK